MNTGLNRIFDAYSIAFTTICGILVSLSVYHYGTGNHAVIVPFLKSEINPDLYPSDYFIAQAKYYHTYLWSILSQLVHWFDLRVEIVFFCTYLMCMALSTAAVFGIAVLLFKNRKVGYLAVFVQTIYFIHNAGIGDEFLMDHLLKESQVALPILLFAIYFFLKSEYKVSYFLMGLGFLIHPLSTIYVVIFLTVPFLWFSYKENWRRPIWPLIIFVIISTPLLLKKVYYSPETMHAFSPYLDWVDMLRARYAGHSFPLSWSIWKYIKAGFLLGLFFFSWRLKPGKLHDAIKLGTFTILGLWVFGLVFTELIQWPLFVQLQLFRSYTLLSLFAVIYWCNYFVVTLDSQQPIWWKCLVVLATIGFIIMLPSEGNPIINEIGNTPSILWKNNYLLILIVGASLVVSFWYSKREMPTTIFYLLLLGLMVLITGKKIISEGISIDSQLPKAWVDIQHWAGTNSSLNDLFIVPPDQRGFRIDGERSIVGDYKDGIQMYFNPEFGYQWIERMQLLGIKDPYNVASLKTDYLGLTEQQVLRIADEFASSHPDIYLVSYQEHGKLDFTRVYENQEFVIYKLPK